MHGDVKLMYTLAVAICKPDDQHASYTIAIYIIIIADSLHVWACHLGTTLTVLEP